MRLRSARLEAGHGLAQVSIGSDHLANFRFHRGAVLEFRVDDTDLRRQYRGGHESEAHDRRVETIGQHWTASCVLKRCRCKFFRAGFEKTSAQELREWAYGNTNARVSGRYRVPAVSNPGTAASTRTD